MKNNWEGHHRFGAPPPVYYPRATYYSPPRRPKPNPIPKPKVRQMSQAIWCDKGDHAFSAKDPNKQSLSRSVPTGRTNDYDEPIMKTESMDICGPCSSKMGLFPSVESDPKGAKSQGDK